MKKPYQKPAIYVENFSLSQSIASTCGIGNPNSTIGKPTTADQYSCAWDMGNISMFVEQSICMITVDPDTHIEGGCYNNPEGGVPIFGWS